MLLFASGESFASVGGARSPVPAAYLASTADAPLSIRTIPTSRCNPPAAGNPETGGKVQLPWAAATKVACNRSLTRLLPASSRRNRNQAAREPR